MACLNKCHVPFSIIWPLLLKYTDSYDFGTGKVEFFPSSSHPVIMPFGLNSELYTLDSTGRLRQYTKKGEKACPYNSIKHLESLDRTGKLGKLNLKTLNALVKSAPSLPEEAKSIPTSSGNDIATENKGNEQKCSIKKERYTLSQLMKIQIPKDKNYDGSTTRFLKFFLVPRVIHATTKGNSAPDKAKVKESIISWLKKNEKSIDSRRGIEEWTESSELDQIIDDKIESYDKKKAPSLSEVINPYAEVYQHIFRVMACVQVKQMYPDEMTRTRCAIFASYLAYYNHPCAPLATVYFDYEKDNQTKDKQNCYSFSRFISSSFINKYFTGLKGRHNSKYLDYVKVLSHIGLVKKYKKHNGMGETSWFSSAFTLRTPVNLWDIDHPGWQFFDIWKELKKHINDDYFRAHYSSSVYTEYFKNEGQRKSSKRQAEENVDEKGVPNF